MESMGLLERPESGLLARIRALDKQVVIGLITAALNVVVIALIAFIVNPYKQDVAHLTGQMEGLAGQVNVAMDAMLSVNTTLALVNVTQLGGQIALLQSNVNSGVTQAANLGANVTQGLQAIRQLQDGLQVLESRVNSLLGPNVTFNGTVSTCIDNSVVSGYDRNTFPALPFLGNNTDMYVLNPLVTLNAAVFVSPGSEVPLVDYTVSINKYQGVVISDSINLQSTWTNIQNQVRLTGVWKLDPLSLYLHIDTGDANRNYNCRYWCLTIQY